MLGKQLKLLRESKQKSQQEVCSALNIEQSTLANYENDKRIPKIDILIKIAEYYHCSVDFLLGIQLPEITGCASPSEAALGLKKRIRSLLEEQKIPEQEFCQELGINLEDELLVSDLANIARKLNVSADYLLGNSECPRISEDDLRYAQSLSDRERNVIDTFRALDSDNQDIMVGELKKCLKEQRRDSVAADESLRKAK